MTSVNDTFTANTLLNWDDSDGIDPGPTYQALTGTYGGTWTKMSDNTTDNVNITWSGATPAGSLGFSPALGVDHHTTNYPSTNGKMPMANLTTCAQQTQNWKYVVSDTGDGTELDLTCHWICHFAFDNFSEQLNQFRDSGQRSDDYTVYLSSPAETSGTAVVDAGSLSASTHFSALSPTGSTTIPGFTPASKHVGVSAFQARVGQITSYPWSAGSSPQTWSAIFGNGNYGIYKSLQYKAHVGYISAWNSKGESEVQTLEYDLDNEGQLVDLPIVPEPHL